MIRIDYLIFGYRKFTFEEKDSTRILNIMLRNNISAVIKENSFVLKESTAKKLAGLLDGKAAYQISQLLGLPGVICKNRKRYGAFCALIISFALTILAGSIVWDVRIEGTDSANHKKIKDELRELGFSVGTFWHGVDKSDIEARMLERSDTVSWVNINRRGTVAYIKVMDKTAYEEEEVPSAYANIIATRDGVIEEITVRNGIAAVKPGETVRAGQILISGVIPGELGGGFCRAEGTVIARYGDEISVEIQRTEIRKETLAPKFVSFGIKFFEKEINIFKIYRNLQNDCVIMKDERESSLPGGRGLPFGTVKKYALEFREAEYTLSDDEMVLRASKKMEESLSSALFGKTLVRIKTDGAFGEDFYILHTSYICTDNIGRVLEFDVQDTLLP